MENADFEKDDIYVECGNCQKGSYIFVNDALSPDFIVCGNCGKEFSEVWCPKCGMGGDFVENIQARPNSWICPRCKTQYQLPASFYEQPVRSYLEEQLPPDMRLRVNPTKTRKEKVKTVLTIFLLGGGFVALVTLVILHMTTLAFIVFGLAVLAFLLIWRF